MLNILIVGANGRLGQTVATCVEQSENMQIVAGVDLVAPATPVKFPVYSNINLVSENVDVIIDFSRPLTLEDILNFAQAKKCPVVLATTGYTEEQRSMIKEYSKDTPVFFSANMSLGVNLQIELAKKAAEVLNFDIEIIEKHHNLKVDSPSGTALAIAEGINSVYDNKKEFIFGRHDKDNRRNKNELAIHAVRGGTVVGEHDVLFLGPDEVIEINHKAYSKQVFATGAIHAAEFMSNKPAGFYNMSDLFADVL